jgi:catalase
MATEALDARTPDTVDAEELTDAVARARGSVWGHRVTHPKGVLLTGTFTASPQARELTRAVHMQGEPVRVTVRFSNGNSNPVNHDADVGDARGMAVKFYLPDGSTTDLLGQAWPAFPSRTPAEFLELMQAQIAGPEKIGEFVEKYPQYVPILQAIDSVPPPRSWATVAFNSINSFKLVTADGADQYVRWRLVPEAGEQELPKSERDGADQDYLMTGIFDELPVHYALRAQLAEEGDPVDDATIAFPAERRWVDMGVIELTGPDLERERDGDLLVNDPMRLTDGIEPSDDPILHVRPRVYDRSIRRRNGTRAPTSSSRSGCPALCGAPPTYRTLSGCPRRRRLPGRLVRLPDGPRGCGTVSRRRSPGRRGGRSARSPGRRRARRRRQP